MREGYWRGSYGEGDRYFLVAFLYAGNDRNDRNGNSNGPVGDGDDSKATPPPGGEGVTAKSNTAWHSTRKLIHVKNRTGFWPIPESFWPDSLAASLVSSCHVIG